MKDGILTNDVKQNTSVTDRLNNLSMLIAERYNDSEILDQITELQKLVQQDKQTLNKVLDIEAMENQLANVMNRLRALQILLNKENFSAHPEELLIVDYEVYFEVISGGIDSVWGHLNSYIEGDKGSWELDTEAKIKL